HTSFSRDWSSDVCSSDLKLTYGAAALDATLGADPGKRAIYVAALLPVLRVAAILGASGRSLAILVACLVGSPIWYCLWEIFGLRDRNSVVEGKGVGRRGV